MRKAFKMYFASLLYGSHHIESGGVSWVSTTYLVVCLQFWLCVCSSGPLHHYLSNIGLTCSWTEAYCCLKTTQLGNSAMVQSFLTLSEGSGVSRYKEQRKSQIYLSLLLHQFITATILTAGLHTEFNSVFSVCVFFFKYNSSFYM